MSHSQQSLADFDEPRPNRESEPGNGHTSESRPEPDESVYEGTEFTVPISEYPKQAIDELKSASIEATLCIVGGTVTPTFATIAGLGGMGGRKPIEKPDAVHSVAADCVGLPVVITGGGMNTPMGSGAVFGRLTDIKYDGGTLQVTTCELYHQHGTARADEQTRTLGSYQLSVPATRTDCVDAVRALAPWEAGDLEYLNPIERNQHERSTRLIESFEALSPADRLDTPAYSTTLEVVSEPFETYAVIPRGTLGERPVEVLAVTVSNPRGGYYQLGIGTDGRIRRGSDTPTCYISHSASTPPTPNTAFTRDKTFASADLDVTPIDHPPDPEVVPPDETVLNSPLPEPRMRTSLETIDGIGEKTARKIRRAADERVSADSLAYTLFGEGDTHQEAIRAIKTILNRLPKHEDIYQQLESYTPMIGEK